MSDIDRLQNHFGFSHEQIADIVCVSRPLISHVSAGRRSLPASASLVLSKLMALLPPDTPARVAAPVTITNKHIDRELRTIKHWCFAKGTYFTDLAAHLRLKHRQASNCLQQLPLVLGTIDQIYAESGKPSADISMMVLQIILKKSKLQIEKYPLELADRCAAMGSQLLAIAGEWRKA
jgi:hypothetical protein